VAINRAIALAMWQGAEAGLEALMPLRAEKAMERYLPYHLAVGDLEARAGRRTPARAAFERALALPMSVQERKLVEAKLKRASDA
jgi:RNA polymerase sigma-70 factor (ECF subfamily)